ncbi:MAG: preprotein translocase subunit YajC [bacterium]
MKAQDNRGQLWEWGLGKVKSVISHQPSAIPASVFLISLPSLAWAAKGESSAARSGGGLITSFLPIILIIGVFYFLVIRPQKQKEQRHQEMLKGLKKGDEVITSGGIHGVIAAVKDETLIVKVGSDAKGADIKLEFSRSAVAQKKESQPTS